MKYTQDKVFVNINDMQIFYTISTGGLSLTPSGGSTTSNALALMRNTAMKSADKYMAYVA